MLNKDEQLKIKEDLLERKSNITEKIKRDEVRKSEEEYSTELSNYDNHPGDSASELDEREKDIALSRHDQEELTNINNALERINSDEYGVCNVCGQPIDVERLNAVPETIYCYEHAKSNANHDSAKEDNNSMIGLEIDETDSWETLESYGSSSSPSEYSDIQSDFNEDASDRDDETAEEDVDDLSNEDDINK